MGMTESERAIVSGATSGIGRAVAVRLAARGAVVGLIGRIRNAAEQVAQEVEAAAEWRLFPRRMYPGRKR